MKTGRNDPCRCGSGIKYKRCHLNREQQGRFSEAHLRTMPKQVKVKEICHYASVEPEACAGQIIKSHTVTKSSCLRKIARDGHVYNFEPSISALLDNGKYVIKKVGINRASTFPGFCSHHDKELFSPFEDKDFAVTAENCTLLGYRALTK